MTKTKKLVLAVGLLCIAVFGAVKYVSYRNAEKLKVMTAYAVAHAPIEAKYMKNSAEYARQYVFAKVPSAGEFYEDENYKFRLLEGLTVEKLINGYLIREVASTAVLRFEEFSDWKTYLDFERQSHVVRFALEGINPIMRYDVPFSIEALTPEIYGEILPDGRKSYELKNGYPAFEILAKDSGAQRGKPVFRHIFFKKPSSQIVRVLILYTGDEGSGNRIIETAARLMLDTLVVKNQNAFSGIDPLFIRDSQLKSLRRGE